MSETGFIATCRLVAGKDLHLEWRTWDTSTSSLVFSLVVLVIFNFAFDLATVRELGVGRLVPGVLWSVIAFAAVIGMTRSFQLEQRHETLSALLLSPCDRSAIFFGKFVANLVKILTLELILVPLTAVLFDYDLLAVLWRMAGLLLLHTIGLTALGTLFAAIAVRVGRGEALLATLLFPASTPLFISAVKTTGVLLGTESTTSVADWLTLTAGFDLLYVFLALLTFEVVVER